MSSKDYISIVRPQNNTEVIVSTVNKDYRNPRMPYYTRYGIDSETQTDIVELMYQMSASAEKYFVMLKRARNPETNIATLWDIEQDKDVSGMNKALKELENLEVIRRLKVTKPLHNLDGTTRKVPKRSFLINPTILIPKRNEDFDTAINYWDQTENM